MGVCTDAKKWVEEQIEQPMERLAERTERQCKKRKWYDPRSWFCWLAVFVVKIVQVVIVTVGKWVAYVVCVVATAILNAAAFIAGLVLSIPIIGPIVRALARIGADAGSLVLGVVDFVGAQVGMKVRKNLRLCIIVLRDGRSPVVNPRDLGPAIAWADNAFYSQAKVRVIVTDITVVHDPSPAANLDVGVGAPAVWEELWAPGSYFETAANGYCFDRAFERLALIGSPIVAFVVRSVEPEATGCSLWSFTDYVTVERGVFVDKPREKTADPTVLAHELGHACLLPHFPGDRNNLMFESSSADREKQRGSALTPTQVHFLRSSRHVTFL